MTTFFLCDERTLAGQRSAQYSVLKHSSATADFAGNAAGACRLSSGYAGRRERADWDGGATSGLATEGRVPSTYPEGYGSW